MKWKICVTIVLIAVVAEKTNAFVFSPVRVVGATPTRTTRTTTTTTTTPTTTNGCAPAAVVETDARPWGKGLGKTVAAAALCFSLSFWGTFPNMAQAASYGSMTDEQKVVAEAWRLVDNSFLDRTFNGQDWFQLRQTYVHKKYKSMAEAQSAIAEMVSKLGDKYTRYLSPSKYQSLVDSATGTLAGVGVEIGTNKQGQVIALDVEENAPAQRAGIQPNDIFIQVDGMRFDDNVNDNDNTPATPDDVALKLRGPPGSKVGIVMERNGKTIDFILTREPIKITSVRSYSGNVGGQKVGVIRIKSFSSTTADTVAQKLDELKSKGVNAFVIDLRGNPGGLLPGGVGTASLFLDENKPLVYVVSKTGMVDAQVTLGTGMDVESPLVILVDGNTASAAEVFTAALQENQRATVVGEQTFGKGVVQTIRGLSNNNNNNNNNNNHGGLSITVARYETPQHKDINKQGISVNIQTPVDCPKDDAMACLAKANNIFTKPEDGS